MNAASSLPESAPEAEATRILVVEDEVLLRIMTAEVLRSEGYQVLEAANAEEAKKLLNAVPPVALVLTDIHMPGQENGVQLATYVRSRYPDISVLLTSGNPGGVELNGHPVIPKPFNWFYLLERVKEALDPDRA
jgi:CheY-like chemotaxis protein